MSWARDRHEQMLVAEMEQRVTLADVDDAELPGHDDWRKD